MINLFSGGDLNSDLNYLKYGNEKYKFTALKWHRCCGDIMINENDDALMDNKNKINILCTKGLHPGTNNVPEALQLFFIRCKDGDQQ